MTAVHRIAAGLTLGAAMMMSAMALVALGFAFVLQRSWHGGRLTTHPEEEDHGFILDSPFPLQQSWRGGAQRRGGP